MEQIQASGGAFAAIRADGKARERWWWMVVVSLMMVEAQRVQSIKVAVFFWVEKVKASWLVCLFLSFFLGWFVGWFVCWLVCCGGGRGLSARSFSMHVRSFEKKVAFLSAKLGSKSMVKLEGFPREKLCMKFGLFFFNDPGTVDGRLTPSLHYLD